MKKIAVFASGRGSNFVAIHQHIENGTIPARIVCLISDNPRAGALEYAERKQIPHYIVRPKAFGDENLFSDALIQLMQRHQVEWIVLAGYLKKIPAVLVNAYAHRIVNIHPALLPFFGGKGMYGMNVHKAVYESGMRVSGPTVHLVTENYDEGPILAQACVDISGCRSPEEVARKVLAMEHTLYPEIIRKVLTTPFFVEGRRVFFK
ncbi:MAG: phosphoribosylglycinamide formyltransferase [Calditrichia bacterium]